MEGLQIVPTLYPNRPLCYSNYLMLSSLQGGGEMRDPGNEGETIRPLVFPLKCLPPTYTVSGSLGHPPSPGGMAS